MMPSLEFAYGIALVATRHLILIRMPLKGKPGNRKGSYLARDFRKAYRSIMNELGIKRDDWFSFDVTSHPDTWDEAAEPLATQTGRAKYREHAAKLEAAYNGEPLFDEFYLFEYRNGTFVKVREPLTVRP